MIGRRALLLGTTSLALSACSKREAARTLGAVRGELDAAEPSLSSMVDGGPTISDGGSATRALLLEFGRDAPSPLAVVLVPAWGAPDAKYPVVVAFHGYAEGTKAPEDGVFGWPRDYALAHAYERLRAPPLTAADFETFVTPEDLARKNEALATRPFGGVIAVCPFVPETGMRSDASARAYASFLTGTLLPRVHRVAPAIAAPHATGLDGVSLGAQFAMRVGFHASTAIGALGALQPAIFAYQAAQWIELVRAARTKNPALKLRLVTSTEDGFREGVTRTSEAFRAIGVDHEFLLLPGPHDYAFNRGPGAFELLLWHDRQLRRSR